MPGKMLCSLALILMSVQGYCQLNMQLVGQKDYEPTVNDIWGYVAPDGTEYALVGNTEGLSVVTLSDPAEPKEVAFVPGQSTTWRDIKTYGEFTYVVSDNTNEGILIVDMQHLPDSVQYAYYREQVDTLGIIQRSHNIYIDDYGLAYLAGTNLGSVLIFDLKPDPWNPQYITKTPGPYAHDVFTQDSFVYASEIYEGRLAVYDARDLDSIELAGSVLTPSRFTHNAWVSDDGKTAFTTDERPNAYVAAYDLSDLSDIRELDRYRPAVTLGEGVIPHNVHVWNDYLIISYYTDGCIIVDAAQPDNLIEVGNFDTWSGAHGGFSGVWGAYPFLPSGLVLASDRQTGLYVFEANYVRGCYLEVNVHDASDMDPVFNAQVSIESAEVVTPDETDFDGLVKIGKAVPGEYIVRVEHPLYFTAEVMATFENGETTVLDIDLVPRSRYDVVGRVRSFSTDDAVPFAKVVVTDGHFTYDTEANEDGEFQITNVLEGSLRLFAGVWGQYTIEEIELTEDFNNDILVNKGYYDDFYFNFGWTVTGTSIGAKWVRGAPNGELLFNTYQCNPDEDVEGDFGNFAFITGNNGGNAANDNVDEGVTILSSPVMDFMHMQEPVLEFRPWLCVRLTDIENYFVSISNGQDTVILDTIFIDGNEGYWRDPVQYALSGQIEFTDMMQLHYTAQDMLQENVVKAGLDAFVLYDAFVSSVSEPEPDNTFKVYPNPNRGAFTLELRAGAIPDQIRLSDVQGRTLKALDWQEGSSTLTVSEHLDPGVYFIYAYSGANLVGVQKVVVTR